MTTLWGSGLAPGGVDKMNGGGEDVDVDEKERRSSGAVSVSGRGGGGVERGAGGGRWSLGGQMLQPGIGESQRAQQCSQAQGKPKTQEGKCESGREAGVHTPTLQSHSNITAIQHKPTHAHTHTHTHRRTAPLLEHTLLQSSIITILYCTVLSHIMACEQQRLSERGQSISFYP